MMTNKVPGARDEFLICASSAARSFISGSEDKLLLPHYPPHHGRPGQSRPAHDRGRGRPIALGRTGTQGVLFQVQPRQ
jgi:hypothetical protein